MTEGVKDAKHKWVGGVNQFMCCTCGWFHNWREVATLGTCKEQWQAHVAAQEPKCILHALAGCVECFCYGTTMRDQIASTIYPETHGHDDLFRQVDDVLKIVAAQEPIAPPAHTANCNGTFRELREEIVTLKKEFDSYGHFWANYASKRCEEILGRHPAPAASSIALPAQTNIGTTVLVRAKTNAAAEPIAPEPPSLTPEALAKQFHEIYERLAPSYGYKTRPASAVSWESVPEQNKALMIATCAEVLAILDDPETAPAPEDWTDEDTDRADHFRDTTKMMENKRNP